jgi:TRAP-type mannitol/chloroaromatic compound transport system substrate-binding protein
MVEVATRAANEDMLSEFTARNSVALATLVTDHGVQLRRLPDDVLDRLRAIALEVVEEGAQDNELAVRIHRSYMDFLTSVKAYHEISERAYINVR